MLYVLLYMSYYILIIAMCVITVNWQESWLADIWQVIIIIKICVQQRYTKDIQIYRIADHLRSMYT